MGNWCTVNLRGSLAKEDVPKVIKFVTVLPDYSNFNCLSGSLQGLAGLGMWPAEEIHADGNLAERNYGEESVAETLREIVAIAPSLSLKVHCGGEYESTKCIATVTAENGVVLCGDPEVETVESISAEEFEGRLFKAIGRR